MKPGVQWRPEEIDTDIHEVAEGAARRAGMTLSEWLNAAIVESEGEQDSATPGGILQGDDHKDVVSAMDGLAENMASIARRLKQTQSEKAASGLSTDHGNHSAAPDSMLRAIERRLEIGKQQATAAFEELHDRLDNLSGQVKPLRKADAHLPGQAGEGCRFNALETALRNVVDHIEVSERRTHKTLKSIQGRMSDLAHGAARAGDERITGSTASIAALEARIGELTGQLQNDSAKTRHAVRVYVEDRLSTLMQRIDAVREETSRSEERFRHIANQTAENQTDTLQRRLQEHITHSQGALDGVNQANAQLQAHLEGLCQQVETIRSQAVSRNDIRSVQVAIEQLAGRVAQGLDLSPLVEIERQVTQLSGQLDTLPPDDVFIAHITGLEQRMAAVADAVASSSRDSVSQRQFADLEQQMHETWKQIISRLSDLESRNRAAQTISCAPTPVQPAADGHAQTRDTLWESVVRKHDEPAPVSALAAVASHCVRPAHEESQAHSFGSSPTAPCAVSSPAEQAEPVPQPAPPSSARESNDYIAAVRAAAQHCQPHVARAVVREGARQARNPALDEKTDLSWPRLKFPRRKKKPVTAGGDAADTDAGGTGGTKQAPAGEFQGSKIVICGALALILASALYSYRPGERQNAGATAAIEQHVAASTKEQFFTSPDHRAENITQAIKASQTGKEDLVVLDPLVTNSISPLAHSVGGRSIEALDAAAFSPALSAEPAVTVDDLPTALGPEDLRQAAIDGNAGAQFIIATRFAEGDGVGKDVGKAAFWYRKSADSGLAPAQYRLGTMYERGRGVIKDSSEAMAWYQRAAGAGNIKAMNNLAKIYANTDSGNSDLALAAGWFRAAAGYGLRDSQYNLAIFYERGLGVGKDIAEAYFWYALAARQNDFDARAKQAALGSQLSNETLNHSARRVEQWKPKPVERQGNLVVLSNESWRSTAAAPAAERADSELLTGPERMREVQKLLAGLGFDVGRTDGVPGARVSDAIRLFQLQTGLPIDGSISNELLRQLKARQSGAI